MIDRRRLAQFGATNRIDLDATITPLVSLAAVPLWIVWVIIIIIRVWKVSMVSLSSARLGSLNLNCFVISRNTIEEASKAAFVSVADPSDEICRKSKFTIFLFSRWSFLCCVCVCSLFWTSPGLVMVGWCISIHLSTCWPEWMGWLPGGRVAHSSTFFRWELLFCAWETLFLLLFGAVPMAKQCSRVSLGGMG